HRCWRRVQPHAVPPRQESLPESRVPFHLHTRDQRPTQPFRTPANLCLIEATPHVGAPEIYASTRICALSVLRRLHFELTENPDVPRQRSNNLEAARFRACASRPHLNHRGAERAILH